MTSAALPVAVMFSFDDVSDTVYSAAFPALDAADFPATFYINSARVGNMAGRVTLAQDLEEMYAAGWDIANHTANHVNLTTIPEAEQEVEIETCSAYLEANGMPRGARHLAYPWGSGNADTLTAMAATGILTGRKCTAGLAYVPVDLAAITGGIKLEPDVSLAAAEHAIDICQPGQYINIIGHLIDDTGANYSWAPADFAALVAYVKAKGCRAVTISEFYAYVQAGYAWP